MKRWTTAALAAVLLISACGGATPSPTPTAGPTDAGSSSAPPASAGDIVQATPGPPPGADPQAAALAARLHSDSYTADTTAAAVAALARSGIGTYADPASAGPEIPVAGAASPLRLLDFQVHSLAVDAWAGHGLSAAQIDTLLPIPDQIHDQTAPASAILAGYVAAVDTPGAAMARALMADQDLTQPDQLHFPLLVLLLFSSDLATDGGRRSATTPAANLGVVAAAVRRPSRASGGELRDLGVATLCSDASAFVDKTINDLFSLLKVAVPNNTVGAIVVSIWNWVVDQGAAFVRTLLKKVTDAVLATVRAIAGGIAGIASEVAGVVPYAVKMRVEPGQQIDLGPDQVQGAFVATVTAGDLPDWPAVLKDCAKDFQVPLPGFAGRDEPMAWDDLVSNVGPLVIPTGSDARTDGSGVARWSFSAGPDPGAAPGQVQVGSISIGVTVHRKELDDARAELSQALFGGLPNWLRGFVDELFSFIVAPLQDKIKALIDTSGSGSAYVIYHGAPPSAAPTRPSASGIAGAWHGSWSSSTYPGAGGGFSLTFSLANGKLSGDIQIGSSFCITTGTVTGTLTGSRIEFGAVAGAQSIAYTGTYSGDRMSGTYHVLAGPTPECSVDDGTWQATR